MMRVPKRGDEEDYIMRLSATMIPAERARTASWMP
jgi:hypothetical protein